MAKLFIGLALAVMLGAAALSFLAKGNITKLQSSLKDTKVQSAAAQDRATKAQAETKKAQEEKTVADAEAKKAQEEASAQKTAATEAAKRADDTAKAAADKDTKIGDLEKAIADLKAAPSGTPKDSGDTERITQLTLQLNEAQAKVAELNTVKDSLKRDADEKSTKLAAAEQREKLRSQNVTRAGLTGRILAVNPGWNFVVLSVGDKNGVTMNAPLLVVRGNEPIARLRITSIEPSTSIADLIPSSVRKGTSIQPGDTVIFEGGRTATPAKSTGAEAEATLPAN